MTVVYASASREEIVQAVRMLPAVLAGTAPDPWGGVAEGFKLRLGFGVLSTIKLEFIKKSRGGTDATGLKWPPLSKEYLAYQRPMKGRGPPKAGGLSPGGGDGFMSRKQLQKWKAIYASTKGSLIANMSDKEASAQAAKRAWGVLKKEGVQTKLEAFGTRDVEMLRDRGLLFNSLSPGILIESEARASYQKPLDQIFIFEQPGTLIVGTNVDYAAYQWPKRPLWPDVDKWLDSWWEGWLELALSGLERVGEQIGRQ